LGGLHVGAFPHMIFGKRDKCKYGVFVISDMSSTSQPLLARRKNKKTQKKQTKKQKTRKFFGKSNTPTKRCNHQHKVHGHDFRKNG
jgi:hypothetical protein